MDIELVENNFSSQMARDIIDRVNKTISKINKLVYIDRHGKYQPRLRDKRVKK